GRLLLVEAAARLRLALRLSLAVAAAACLRALPARRAVAGAEGFHVVEARRAIAAAAAPTAAAPGLRDLDIRRRQLVEETRGDRGRPGAMDAAVGGEIEFRAAARASQPDMGEAALFLQPRAALFVERALAREQAFLPTRQEH